MAFRLYPVVLSVTTPGSSSRLEQEKAWNTLEHSPHIFSCDPLTTFPRSGEGVDEARKGWKPQETPWVPGLHPLSAAFGTVALVTEPLQAKF